MSKSATVRAKIEGELNSMLFLSAGLMAHVATHPEISSKEFGLLANEIVARGRNIRNIALAKDNIISHLYPIAGNEAALGLDYTKLPNQWLAVKKAIETRRTVVAGPVDLVQGGQGIIIRTPIFTRFDAAGFFDPKANSYWGLSSIVVDSQGFLNSVDFEAVSDDIMFALKTASAQNQTGKLIAGNQGVFSSYNILTPISIPNGGWVLAATPVQGWQLSMAHIWLMRSAGWLLSILFGALIIALSLSRELNRNLAFHDHLTDLPNRRLLDDRLSQVLIYSKRYSSSFGIFYLDLDKFKPINDTYGHKVGDGVIKEAARRMRASVRESDTVARVGGDEFIVLVNDIRQCEDMDNIREQFVINFDEPAHIAGHKIQIHVSIGYAIYPEDGLKTEQLERAADERMYQDKTSDKS